MVTIPTMRRERFHLLILRNLIEEAAAPDEPVLVDSWFVYRFLHWKSSPALRLQLVLHRDADAIPASLPPSQEFLVVSTRSSELENELRSRGYTLTPDAAQTRWLTTGNAVSISRHGPLLIEFAAPPVSRPLSSEQPWDGEQ